MRRALLAFFCLLLAACSGTRDPLPADTLVRLGAGEIRSLDPALFTDATSAQIAYDQFEGLTRYNGKGEVVGALAQSWTTSSDGLVWTFRLRDGLTFSDGAPIRANLFPQLFTRVRDAENPSPHALLYTAVDRIEAPDAGTVRVVLAQPFPELPALFAHPSMAAVPMHIIDRKGEGWTAERPLVVSGPYRLKSWTLNKELRLESNPRWHGGSPRIANIVWRPSGDSLSGMRTFLAGEADIAADFPENRRSWLEKRYPGVAHVFPIFGTYYVTMNVRKPPFDNVDVRTALAMAVERRWIVKMLDSGNPPAWGMVPPGLSGLRDWRPAWAEWPRARRLAEARRLLARAGYGPQRPLNFEFRFNSSAQHRRVAAALATMWRDLGVEARMLNSEAGLHFDAMQRGDFQIARAGWLADLPAPENFLAIHRADAGPGNYSGYDSARYMTLLDAAMDEADPAARARKMRRAEVQLMTDMPVIPIMFYGTRALVGPRVGGWHDNIADMHPSVDLWLKGK